MLQQAIEQTHPIPRLSNARLEISRSTQLRHNHQRRLHTLLAMLTLANRAVDDVLTGREFG
jgi:hypothetical protein